MSQKDMLDGLKRSEEKAEKILERGRSKREELRRRAELAKADVLKDMARDSDAKVARMEKDTQAAVDRLRDESGSVGRARAEALRKAAEGRMPVLVDELVAKFKERMEKEYGE